MKFASIEEAYAHILKKDPRYDVEAYVFVKDALDYTVEKFKRASSPQQPGKHVSGRELLDGMREFALAQFGPLTRTVLKTWGLNQSEDVGEVVFNLVDNGILGKTDEDSRGDFADGYDFDEAFSSPFLPKPESADDTLPAPTESPSPSRKKS